METIIQQLLYNKFEGVNSKNTEVVTLNEKTEIGVFNEFSPFKKRTGLLTLVGGLNPLRWN